MWSIPSLPLLPCPVLPGEVAPDKVLSMGQIELFRVQTNDCLIELFVIHRNTWNHLTVFM